MWLAFIVGLEALIVIALITGVIVVLWPSQAGSIGAVLSALAAFALAAITLVVVLLNRQLLAANTEAVLAATSEAKASNRQADLAEKTLKELQDSRHLEFRPFLICEDQALNELTPDGLVRTQIEIRNVGRGPAINCMYLGEYQTDSGRIYRRSAPIDLAPGGFQQVAAEPVKSPAPQSLLGGKSHLDEILVCQDQFNNVVRFHPGYAYPKEWELELDEEGFPTFVPDWVDSYMGMVRIYRP